MGTASLYSRAKHRGLTSPLSPPAGPRLCHEPAEDAKQQGGICFELFVWSVVFLAGLAPRTSDWISQVLRHRKSNKFISSAVGLVRLNSNKQPDPSSRDSIHCKGLL